MKYADLVQAYFERSTALQWYWPIYVLVIGGVLAFSSFRQRPDLITTILVTILYGCFAYKNLGAIEDTLRERQAFLGTLKEYPASGPDAPNIQRVRDKVEPTLLTADYEGTRYFHLA